MGNQTKTSVKMRVCKKVRLRIYAEAEKRTGGETHRHSHKPTTIKTYRKMNKETFVAFATQKGGVGKSTVTALVANYIHNVMGIDVAVIDCDEPQHSIAGLRDKETALIEKNDSLKAVAYEHFRKSGRKGFPIIRSNAVQALDDADSLLSEKGYRPEIVFFDLPGTLKSDGVIKTLSQMDYIFTPVSADRFVVESALQFVMMFNDNLVTTGLAKTKDISLFWTMVDGREKTGLYDLYGKLFAENNFRVLDTRLPDSKRFRREPSDDRKPVFRSTILPPDTSMLKGSRIRELSEEICSIVNG